MNKSEELAKIVGIRPVYSMWINIGDLDNRYIKVTNKRKYKLIAENRDYFDDYDFCPEIKIEYPDFNRSDNKDKLINLLIETGHSIEMSKGYYCINNDDLDFVYDCYDTKFGISGKTLLSAIINYLTMWIESKINVKMPDGSMSGWQDSSHTLTREECIYPRGFDDLQKDINNIIEQAKFIEWEY